MSPINCLWFSEQNLPNILKIQSIKCSFGYHVTYTHMHACFHTPLHTYTRVQATCIKNGVCFTQHLYSFRWTFRIRWYTFLKSVKQKKENYNFARYYTKCLHAYMLNTYKTCYVHTCYTHLYATFISTCICSEKHIFT